MVKKFVAKLGIAMVLVVVFLLLILSSPYFLTVTNLINILLQVSITSIVGVGMTFVILTGGIDLSVGSIVALCIVTLASVHKFFDAMLLSPMNYFLLAVVIPILVCVIVGGIVGFINGIIISKWNVPAFIMTFGMMSMARGMAYIVTNNETISVFPKVLTWLGGGKILQIIPVPVVIALAFIIIASFILKYTKFGRYIYALGGNRETLRLSGVNTVITEVAAYVIGGVMCAVSAVILLGRLNVAQPLAGSGYELDAIGAVIIGGTSINGGEGKVTGTLMGALLMGMIRNGLNMLNASTNLQLLVIGAIIVVAVFYDKARQKWLDIA